MQDTDFARLPKDFLLIFTDFAAVMALRAFQAKNLSVDAHAINEFTLYLQLKECKREGEGKEDWRSGCA